MSNNELKDEFAAFVCYNIADNVTIKSVKLQGNSISLKEIRKIETVIHKNKYLKNQQKIPNYKAEISRLKIDANSFDEATKLIDKTSKECNREEKKVKIFRETLRKIENKVKVSTERLLQEDKELKDQFTRIKDELQELEVRYAKELQEFRNQVQKLQWNNAKVSSEIDHFLIECNSY